MTPPDSQHALASGYAAPVVEYVERIVVDGSTARLSRLVGSDFVSDLPVVRGRHGVTCVSLRTSDLHEDEILAILRYRLAQYLLVGFVDPGLVYQDQLRHEPRSGVHPEDVHVLALDAQDGEILCYVSIMAIAHPDAVATLRDHDRPLFPVEQAHGWGIYNRLRQLPDIPVGRVREVGRFVKNHREGVKKELAVRAPIEVALAAYRLFRGSLRAEVDAFIGDLEEVVAKQNLDYFHTPSVVLHGTVVHVDKRHYKYPMYRHHNHYPFAVLVSDLTGSAARSVAIDAALEQPGRAGIAALLSLRDAGSTMRSTLEPADGVGPLGSADVADRRATMSVRRAMLDAGDALRGTEVFASLSSPEAATLVSYLQRVDLAADAFLMRQGDVGDDFYVILDGVADVRRITRAGTSVAIATLVAGDIVGEIGAVTGQPRTADVVALTPMRVLRVTRAVAARFLDPAPDVRLALARLAARRAAELITLAGG